MNDAYARFCAELPKAELHLHIEGTLSPQQRLHLARRNGLTVRHGSIAELEAARNFGAAGTPQEDLKEMLDYYYEGIEVLRTERDFFDITYDYLRQCQAENIRYAEISFDPQAHTARGLPFAAVIDGLHNGLVAGEAAFGVRARLVMCINRDRSVESAFEALRAAAAYREWIAGVGLDSIEQGNPPLKFKAVFDRARAQGYRLTAHCDVDQQDSVRHIWQCIDELGVDRIDHGINCIEDVALVSALRARRTCLTACPTWRPRDAGPRRVDRMRTMFDLGLRVTMNSDDPGVLASGSLGHLMPHAGAAGSFTPAELARFSIHAFEGAWLPSAERDAYVREVTDYLRSAERGLQAGQAAGAS
ncbi:adenosine deaminase [Variovorax sp. WS11]|uniref:adenosine deaminase n=1 Tax=Variovorax sp. WS11 TaxID=1105204 RepID=UPI000D0CDD67|nr:adenosine deaminase [Variovorax sp. WS11]NDZ17427.1 adenosine deaminase [Variovorax sp. WS11]PSL86037.1 adenosine deaminase [Variovorax sp. WS11]